MPRSGFLGLVFSAGMTLAAVAMVLPGGSSVGAQETRPARPVRVVLASSTVPSVTATPLHWKLVRVTVSAGQSVTYEGPVGVIGLVSGTMTIGRSDDRTTLQEGEGAVVPAGQRVTFTAGRAGAAVGMHYVLVSASHLGGSFHAPAPAAVELGRSERIPALKPGPYELSMTRVSVQPKVPAPPMHHRAGAAFYYVLAGTWSIHLEGNRQEPRTRGATQFEPNGFWHTWENTGDVVGALLQANLSPEGSPEIIFASRP